MKMHNVLFSLITLLAVVLYGCEKDFLDQKPLDTITTADFFKTANDMEIYMNGFYAKNLVLGSNLTWRRGIYSSEVNSDNQINTVFDGIDLRLNGTMTTPPASGGSWDYSNVRSIAYFFDNYKRCEDDLENYRQYLGEAYFFRAVIYFRLLRDFGDVVWIESTLNVDSEELYDPRTARNIIADHIISDLDSAAKYLSEEVLKGGTRINKWAALAYQSRVALYEGTWEKYHDGTPFGVDNPDPDKYFRTVINAAEKVMESGVYEIYSTGDKDNDYHDLFGMTSYEGNKEIIYWKKYSKELGLPTTFNYYALNPWNEGLTKGLVDSYLCTDGDPISISPLFQGYDTITNEFKNRDPRLQQSVWGPEAPWKIDGTDTTYWEKMWVKLNSRDTYNSPTGYVNRKGSNPHVETQKNTGSDGGVIIIRFAEVLLNFAEAKAELGELTQADIDISIKLIRDRVGMPNLDIANIKTDNSWDFPDLSPVINEIRRERRVELVSEGFRLDDILRWAAADELIAGKRPKGIKVGTQIPYNEYPLDENGFMDPYQEILGDDGYGFDVNRDYLLPIPTNEIVLNPKLKQNPGW